MSFVSPPTEPTKGTSWPRLVLRAVGLGVLLVLLVQHGDRLRDELATLDRWVAEMGPEGPFVFALGLAVLIPLFVPVTALKVAAGTLFGPVVGILSYLAGQYLAALVMYALSRRALSGPVRRVVERQPRLHVLRDAAASGTARRQFVVRMLPLSFALVSYVLSSLGVKLKPYLLGCLASVPSTIFTVWLGHTARHLATFEDLKSLVSLRPADLAMLAAALVLLVLLVRKARPQLRQARMEAQARASADPDGPLPG